MKKIFSGTKCELVNEHEIQHKKLKCNEALKSKKSFNIVEFDKQDRIEEKSRERNFLNLINFFFSIWQVGGMIERW